MKQLLAAFCELNNGRAHKIYRLESVYHGTVGRSYLISMVFFSFLNFLQPTGKQ